MSDQKKETIKEPPAAGACQSIAVISLIIGGIMIAFAIATPSGLGIFSFVVTAITLLISSIFWFALSRIIILLAQIERNTRK